MILYKSADGHFWPTQDAAKQHKRSTGSTFEQVNVPTTEGRDALAEFLNALRSQNSLRVQAEIVADEGNDDHVPTLSAQDEQDEVLVEAQEVAAKSQAAQEAYTALKVEEFILNRATPAQVEAIFARIGTRFSELVKKEALLS